MKKWIKFIIRTFIIILGIGLLSLSLFLFFTEYEKFIFIILDRAGKLHKIEEFKTEYLSKTKFILIKFLLSTITLFYFTAIYKWYKLFEKNTLDLFDYIITGFKTEILKISKKDWYLFSFVFALASLVKIYYFFTHPITNDEAFTFLNYVNQGFAASLTYYNLTNNHIFHSLLCNVFNMLSISPLHSLRIASFLAGSFTLFVVFILFKKLLSSKAAFLAFVFFSFAPPTMQYGFLARGYSLILLFTAISTFALLELFQKKGNTKKLCLLFIVASALGFYSIPVYVYVFVSHLTFCFIHSLTNNKKLLINHLKELFLVSSIVGLIVAVLYSPVVLLSGLDSLIGNEYVEGLSVSEFAEKIPAFLLNYFKWIFGRNIYLSILASIILPISLIYSFRKKKNLFLLIVSFLIVPIILTSIQRIIPYNRLFVFIILFISLAIGLFVEFIIQKFKLKKVLSNVFLFSSAALLILVMLTSLDNLCKQQKTQNNMAYGFADKVENNSTIFCAHRARYYTFLKFKAMFLDKKEIELFLEDFDKNFAYDFISEIKAENEDFVSNSKYKYSIIYDDEFIKLYKKQ